MSDTPTSSSHLSARALTIRRGGRTLVDQLSVTASAGTVLAIVGENGRGKTTLLHTLAGRFEPHAGAVTRHGTVGIAEQQMPVTAHGTVGDAVRVALQPSLDALAELDRAGQALADAGAGAGDAFDAALAHAEKLDAWDAERRVRVALAALEAEQDFGTELRTLSVGQRYRVRLACLLGGSDDILLLDEPTNHLDHAGLTYLTESLRSRRGPVVLVSHDRALLGDVATTVVDLDPTPDGLPRVYGDGYAGYRAGRAALRARWEQSYSAEQARRAELEGSLAHARSRLHTGWRPGKGTGKHTRAMRTDGVVRTVKRRQAELENHAGNVPEPPLQLRFPELPTRPGARFLTAEEVTCDGRLDRPVSLTVRGGDKWVVTGRNGAGKTTLLQVLAGELSPTCGRVLRSGRIAALSQESRGASDGVAPAARQLGLLNDEEARRPFREMSMGQFRRLDLAGVLASEPQVLLLDEPTNHLSIRLVDELTAALAATPAAVVLVTHDRQLLRDTAAWKHLEL